MMDSVEKLRQIQIHHHPMARFQMRACLGHGLLRSSAFAKTAARLVKSGVEQRFQDLQHRLLHHSVAHRRHPEIPIPAPIGLRNRHPAYRLWPISLGQ